jgi:ABC-type Fe3+ transport system permease subunit
MFTKIAKPIMAVGPAAALLVSRATFASDASQIQNNLPTGVDTNGSIKDIFTKVINILFIVIGGLAVIMLIVGGIMYVVSAGDSKRVESAKNTILYALIGIVVAAVAGFLVNFVLNGLK